MNQNTDFCDPADTAIDDSLRDRLYEDLHEDETPENMATRLSHEAYREASERLLPIILGTLQFVMDGGRSLEDVRFRLAVAGHYFQHPVYANKSMAEICASFNKTRAAGSAAALKFQRGNHLPELLGQKSQETRAGYHNKRRETICKTN